MEVTLASTTVEAGVLLATTLTLPEVAVEANPMACRSVPSSKIVMVVLCLVDVDVPSGFAVELPSTASSELSGFRVGDDVTSGANVMFNLRSFPLKLGRGKGTETAELVGTLRGRPNGNRKRKPEAIVEPPTFGDDSDRPPQHIQHCTAAKHTTLTSMNAAQAKK